MIKIIKLPFTLMIRVYYKLNPSKYRIDKWKKEGCPVPPPREIKVETITKYAKSVNAKIFIETGTFMGDTSNDMIPHMDKVYSIELDMDLYNKATDRFKKFKQVKIIQGDSGEKLEDLLNNQNTINQKAVFWLDGHYSAGITANGELMTPIIKELNSIRSHMKSNSVKHLILIDDAHCFNGTDDYPTIEQMQEYCKTNLSSYSYELVNNIIIFNPPK